MLVTRREIENWPSGSDEFVEAFAKGLAVIGAFGESGGTVSISDLSKRTGLPRAGIRRLVLTLVTLGLAEERDGRFALTQRVMRLGYAYLSSLDLRQVAQPVIESLARECGEVVAVSVLDGDEIVYVARAEPQSVLRRSLTIGSRLPAFCTSMGRVLLSGLSEDALATYFTRATFTAYTRHTVTDRSALEQEILSVRQQGWMFVSEELELGTCGMAAPIKDHRGHIIAALNISTNLGRYSGRAFVKRFKAQLLDIAGEISARLPMS